MKTIINQTSERTFRVSKVIPFLKTLKNTAFFAIQQKTICGDPDFMLSVRGRFVGLELKKSWSAKPRILQVFKLDKIEKSGGVAIVAYPENWEKVKQQLSEMDEKEISWNQK